MRLLIFIFHYRFRKQALNNILKRVKINNYYLLNLSGPFFSIIGKFLKFLNVGRYISCDGEPFIKKSGINLWMGGSGLKIPNHYKNFMNNCVIMKNIFQSEKNLIQFYPTLIKKSSFSQNFKFIYIGEALVDKDKIIEDLWDEKKNEILKDYSLIDSKAFWDRFSHSSFNDLQTYYIKMKNKLRYYSIIEISKKLNEKLILVGSNWKQGTKNFKENNFKSHYVRSLYKNNVCLDFGSKWGSLSLYPRSIEIIESGGFLLQSLQKDSKEIFGSNFNNITFNSFDSMMDKIDFFIENPDYLNDYFKKIVNIFENDQLNNKSLDKIWEISKN